VVRGGVRRQAIHHLLSTIPYTHVEKARLDLPKRPATTGYQRPPRDTQSFVADHAAKLELAAAAGEKPRQREGEH
jgi:polyphosphate kinase